MSRAAVLVAPGAGLRLGGVDWTVEEIEPHLGRIVLAGPGGERERRSLRWLANHPDLRSAASEGPAVSRQSVVLSDLTEDQLVRARLRAEHLLEAETGYRSGSPLRALPHEPRPGFDPETTFLKDRRLAKAREIKEMSPAEAKRLGLDHLSFRTLERLGSWPQMWPGPGGVSPLPQGPVPEESQIHSRNRTKGTVTSTRIRRTVRSPVGGLLPSGRCSGTCLSRRRSP
ncbi:hypothetical protein ACFV1W_10575 [Kitasatospora sp. NPDC059648]|uniref:hypothetical protein n=1 Tax=Kitasatospora sp. NPDC059648 TaxID=3346894 RepID=UPI0036B00838